MPTVLVVDDEPMVRDVVVRYLEREGYTIHQAADGRRAREIIEAHELDLVVLDVMLPEIGGFDLCRWVRERSSLPVIMLSARGDESDRIVGLELGADDYVTKPFSPRELVARVRSVIRRAALPSTLDGAEASQSGESTLPLAFGGRLEIDLVGRRVHDDGVELDLTAKEFDLLHHLCAHPGQVFTRGQLLQQVWGHEADLDVGGATVTVHVRRLREKVELDASHPVHIQTVRGVGYRYEP